MSNSSNTNKMLEVTGHVLIRCFVMGFIVLVFWFGALSLAGELAYTVHSKIVLPISREQFYFIHYAGMLMTKAAISIMFLFPYIAIRLVTSEKRK